MLLKMNRNKAIESFSFSKQDLIKYGENVRVFGEGVTIDNFKFKTGQYPTIVYFLFKKGTSIVPIFIWSDGDKTDTESEIFLTMAEEEFEILPEDYYKITALFINDNFKIMSVDLSIKISCEKQLTNNSSIKEKNSEDDDEPIITTGGYSDNIGDVVIPGGDVLPEEEVSGL